MKLKKIAVSGFKSFVDQTHISFNAQIVGVVGPNGCGKSNVIDAVRWVMGESSAKMLRGDSMDDVIFNGSSTRKPVGRASVELLFDNSLGRIKGHYQQFAEIAVKRVLGRDGKSEYRINEKRVRRKDVLDMFRGTGLGPRSYSIIEQGMVSRIVESKPEDLRAYVEEAAGISRYKDRRRETENRIRHTRENIERSEDIRGELLAQLRRLKRQAQAAARYKTLQEKRRTAAAMLYRLRFDAFSDQIQSEQSALEISSNKLEKEISNQRKIEAYIERKRSEQGIAQDALSEVQAAFYAAGADVSRVEQKIEHIKANKEQDSKALSEVNGELEQLMLQIQADQLSLAQYQADIETLLPLLQADETSLTRQRLAYEQAREEFNQWQSQSSRHQQQQSTQTSQKELQLSIIDQINREQNRAEERQQHLEKEQLELKHELDQSGLTPVFETLKTRQDELDQLQLRLKTAQSVVGNSAEQLIGLKNSHNEQAALLTSTKTRIRSLEEFQAAALGSDHQEYKDWLSKSRLVNDDLVATQISIEKGMERAADRVLAPLLNARIDQTCQHELWLQSAEHAVTLVSIDRQKQAAATVSLPLLADFIEAQAIDIHALIAGVYVAENAAEAQQHRLALNHGERIVTREGAVYGANWVSHAGSAAINTGYLVREEEMLSLKERRQEIANQIDQLQLHIERAQQAEISARRELVSLQAEQEKAREDIAETQREITQLNTAQEYAQSRLASIEQELKQIMDQGDEEKHRLDEAADVLETVEQALEINRLDQQKFIIHETVVKERIEKTNLIYREQQAVAQVRKLDQTRLETSIASLNSSLERMQKQYAQYKTRKQGLLDSFDSSAAPLDDLNASLQQGLVEHRSIEEKLSVARDEIAGHDNALRELQSNLSSCVEAVNFAREAQDAGRLALQDRQVRQQSLDEEAARDNYVISEINLPQDCPDVEEAKQMIADLERKIGAIGAVNLVAIDEYETQSERAEYLEKQHADLLDALDTLEKVIQKIDKETRVRFEQTYNVLNRNFSRYFPKLFGGGKASLNLTSDDWLSTGVTVLAQPPGKRNSTIHLLSGGEKALTAVSLLFWFIRA